MNDYEQDHYFKTIVNNDTAVDWSEIFGLFCGEICIHLLSESNKDRYINDVEYRGKIVDLIKIKTVSEKGENSYSLSVSLNKRTLNEHEQ
jgi:hypothetical protein